MSVFLFGLWNSGAHFERQLRLGHPAGAGPRAISKHTPMGLPQFFSITGMAHQTPWQTKIQSIPSQSKTLEHKTSFPFSFHEQYKHGTPDREVCWARTPYLWSWGTVLSKKRGVTMGVTLAAGRALRLAHRKTDGTGLGTRVIPTLFRLSSGEGPWRGTRSLAACISVLATVQARRCHLLLGRSRLQSLMPLLKVE